jgi:hypothetical protein
MAVEGQQLTWTFKADNDLSAKQFYFVKRTSTGVDVADATSTGAIGVLQNKPKQYQAALVCMIGVTKMSSDAALAIGNIVGPSSDGQAQVLTPGHADDPWAYGTVIDAATGAAGELATVLINCATPTGTT